MSLWYYSDTKSWGMFYIGIFELFQKNVQMPWSYICTLLEAVDISHFVKFLTFFQLSEMWLASFLVGIWSAHKDYRLCFLPICEY